MCLLLTVPKPITFTSLTLLDEPNPEQPILSPLTNPPTRPPPISTDPAQPPTRTIPQDRTQALHNENSVSEEEQAEDQEWIQEWLAFIERGMTRVQADSENEGIESPRPDGALRRRRLMDFFSEMRVEASVG